MNENAKDRAKRIAKWLWDCSNSTTSEEYDTGLLTGEFEKVAQQATQVANKAAAEWCDLAAGMADLSDDVGEMIALRKAAKHFKELAK